MNREANSQPSAHQLCQQANFYAAQRQFEQAAALCDQALNLQPDFAPAYKIMGIIRQMQGEHEEAKNWYHQALEIQPNFAEVYANLGTVYASEEHWELAIKSYKTALDLQPNLAGVCRNLARIWQRKKEPEKVAFYQYEAFLLEPENLELEDYLKLGDTLSNQKQFEKLIHLYSQALKFYPKAAKIYYLLGKALSHEKQWQAAIDTYKNAIKIDPNAAHYYNSLGDAFAQTKEWDEAVNCYVQSLKINPNFCWSYFKLADAYFEYKQWENAIKTYRRGLKLYPEHYWPYIKLANALVEQNQIEEAIFTYHQAIEIYPNAEQYYYGLGNILLLQKRWDDAINYYIQALEVKPDFVSVYHKLAEIFDAQNLRETAYLCRQNKKLTSDIIQKYLGGEKGRSIPAFCDPKITFFSVKEEEFFVALLSGGRVWGDGANSVAINSENKAIEDFSTGCPELVISSRKLPLPVELNQTIVFLSVRWGRDYYHWMIDILPQFYLLEKAGINFDEIDKFVVNANDLSFHKETLKKLRIDPKKIITSQDYPHIKAPKIIVPTPRCKTQSKIQSWACDFVRNTILPNQILETIQQTERIYINRGRAGSRHIVNQESVNILLDKFQFKNVFLELISVEEQALLFASAQIVVSPHGAGLTNLIFCQPKTKVIEIFSPNYTPDLYQKICQFYNLQYFPFLGTPFSNMLAVERNQDIWVDCDELDNVLSKVIKS